MSNNPLQRIRHTAGPLSLRVRCPMNDLFLTIILVLYFTAYITALNFFIKLRKKRQSERKQKFFKTLIEGLKSGSILSLNDVVNIYKGIFGYSVEDLNFRYSLSKLLREFLVDIISKDRKIINDSISDNSILQWKEMLTEFINQNEKISPYADLPETERNILTDISVFIEKNDLDSVKRKLLELAAMIQARNDDLNKIRNINRWTVPLSIIGLIFTIIFGILSFLK